MSARRTNKKRPLRQTTGEKFPAAVVNTQAESASVAKEPAPEEPALQETAAEQAVEEATMEEIVGEAPLGGAPSNTEVPSEQTIIDAAAAAADNEAARSDAEAGTAEISADDAEAKAGATAEPEPAAEPAPSTGPAAASRPPAEPESTPAEPAPKPKPARTTRRASRKPEPEIVIAPATEHAEAEGVVLMSATAQIAALKTCGTAQDMIASARATGILAGKRAGELVPSCPARTVSACRVGIRPIAPSSEAGLKGWEPAREDGRAGFTLQAAVDGCDAGAAQTGALAAVGAAGLALFDLLRTEDPAIEIGSAHILGTEPAPVEEDVQAGETAPAAAPAEPASPLPGGTGSGTPAPAIAFIGYQNAGKTTLVERVISKLSGRGLRVGSIKLHGPKGFDIDQPGKDSWRHAQAGSRHVGLISPDQYAEYASTEHEVPVADLLTHFTDVDVVVVEGYKTTGIPSIVVARSGVDRIRGINSYDLVDANTIAVACNDVTARGFRAQWSKMAEEAGEQPNATAPVPLPSFLDINDVPEIVSFVVDKLELSKK